MRLTIGGKVLLGNLGMVALMCAAVLWVVRDLRRMDDLVELTVNAQEQIIRINKISDDINEILYRGGIKVSMFQVGAFAASRDADEMTRSLRFRRAHRDSLLAEVSRSRFGQRPALKYSLDSLLIACRKLDLLFESVELHFERGQPGRAERAFGQLHEVDAELSRAMTSLQEHAQEDANVLLAAASRFREHLILRAGVVLAVLLAGMLAMVMYLNRTIKRATAGISNALSAVASGDFQQRVELVSKDEFSEIAEGLNATVERLGELDALKADFLSKVSHDLRTPIAAVKQAAELLNDGIPSPLKEDQKEILQIIRTNAKRLGNLINDLLDTARLEAGKLEIQPETTDLVAIIRRVATSIAPLSMEKRLRITLKAAPDLPPAYADPNRMEQVLMNLLGNAVKFTPENGEIALSCEQEGAFLRCSVRDTGVGIPPEDLPRIFDKFHQVRMKRATKTKGTGLGLTIVKLLVEAHGGFVWAESTPGQGATFAFTVPVVEQPGEGEDVRYSGMREEDADVRPD